MKHARLLTLICGSLAFWIASSARAQSSLPVDPVWLPGGPPAIEWKSTWEETYRANRTKWEQELATSKDDEWMRTRYLRARTVVLLDALVRRYPDDAKRRATAYEEISSSLFGLGQRSAGFAYNKREAEEFPDDMAKTTRGLQLILERAKHVQSPEPEPWLNYATDRVFALVKAGRILPNDPLVELAWWGRFDVAEHHHWLEDAQIALSKVPDAKSDRVRMQQAELFSQGGRTAEAMAIYRDFAATNRGGQGEAKAARSELRGARPAHPRNLGLESQWQANASRQDDFHADKLQPLLDKSAEDDGLFQVSEPVLTSFWVAVDGLLRKQSPRNLLSLRENQERAARAAVEQLRADDDPRAALLLFRRLPSAASVCQLLAEYGERMLRHGNPQWALAAFRDVMAHSPDDRVRHSAQAGIWLALASLKPSQEEIEEAFAGISPDQVFPWWGKSKTAADIRRELENLSPASPTSPGRPAPTMTTLTMPPAIAWGADRIGMDEADNDSNHRHWDVRLGTLTHPLGQLQAAGGSILLAGPRLLACYREDPKQPAWFCTVEPAPWRVAHSKRPAEFGTFVPWLDDRSGTIYTRWSHDASDEFAPHVAAFDVRTGKRLWSTEGRPAWQDLLPGSDPVLCEGQIYLTTVGDSRSMTTISLACLSARDGAMLWRRPLSVVTNPEQEDTRPLLGSAVTVRQGRVYCTTNAGMVACCDARDGLVQWATVLRAGGGMPELHRRQGAPPLIAGKMAVFMTRDYPGIIAVDRDTGAPRWDNWTVPSMESLGRFQNSVLLKDQRHVAAVDLATGHTLWSRLLPDRILSAVADGPVVHVSTATSRLRLSADSGSVLATDSWPNGVPMREMLVHRGEIVGITEESVATPEKSPAVSPRQSAAGGPIALSLKKIWSVHLPLPRLLRPPEALGLAPRTYVLSQNLLTCVLLTPDGPIEWRRYVPHTLLGVEWTPESMLLVCHERLMAIDPRSGRRQWELSLPGDLHEWQVAAPYMVFRTRESMSHGVLLCVDLRQGKLLWERPPKSVKDDIPEPACVIVGGQIHVLGRNIYFIMRAEDGMVMRLQKLPHWPAAATADTESVYYFADRRAWSAKLGQATPPTPCSRQLDVQTDSWLGIQKMAVSDGWLTLRDGSIAKRYQYWFLRTSDPNFVFRSGESAQLVDGTVYEDQPSALQATDLATMQRRRYELPGVKPSRKFMREIRDYRLEGDKLLILSAEGSIRSEGEPGKLTLSLFDRLTGKLEGQQELHLRQYMSAWETTPGSRAEFITAGGVIGITDVDGLHGYVPVGH